MQVLVDRPLGRPELTEAVPASGRRPSAAHEGSYHPPSRRRSYPAAASPATPRFATISSLSRPSWPPPNRRTNRREETSRTPPDGVVTEEGHPRRPLGNLHRSRLRGSLEHESSRPKANARGHRERKSLRRRAFAAQHPGGGLFEKFPERSDRVRRGVENEARHRRGSLIDRPTSSSMAVGQRSTSMRIRLPTRNASGGSPTPPAPVPDHPVEVVAAAVHDHVRIALVRLARDRRRHLRIALRRGARRRGRLPPGRGRRLRQRRWRAGRLPRIVGHARLREGEGECALPAGAGGALGLRSAVDVISRSSPTASQRTGAPGSSRPPRRRSAPCRCPRTLPLELVPVVAPALLDRVQVRPVGGAHDVGADLLRGRAGDRQGSASPGSPRPPPPPRP